MVGGRVRDWCTCIGARNAAALLAVPYTAVDCVSAAVGNGSVLAHYQVL